MIRPGELRERIAVMSSSQTRNALGETVLSWSEYATRWASVEGVSAREALLNDQQDVSVTHRIRMRYLDGLNQNMRIHWRGRTLEITSLLEHNNRSEHELICSESV